MFEDNETILNIIQPSFYDEDVFPEIFRGYYRNCIKDLAKNYFNLGKKPAARVFNQTIVDMYCAIKLKKVDIEKTDLDELFFSIAKKNLFKKKMELCGSGHKQMMKRRRKALTGIS